MNGAEPHKSNEEVTVKAPDDLLAAATAAHGNAYVPYSDFRVGAALRAASGKIYSGANIENASYPMSRCAEQSAIQAMASAGERGFGELVVYTQVSPPATPCGGCRQVLVEFGEPSVPVYMVNGQGETVVMTLAELLPGAFSLKQV